MSSNQFLENLKYKSVENIETTLSPSAKLKTLLIKIWHIFYIIM
jgi:hypothetical protein